MLSRPVRVADAAGLVAAFTYNDDYDRATEQITRGTTPLQAKTFMAEGKYEIVAGQGDEKQRLYLDGSPYDASIVLEKVGSSAPQLYWLHRDYLGSITHISNNSGNLAAEYSYDAWGRLRDAANWQPFAPDAMPELMFGRGYTGHEHLTGFGLINMNARLYDPVLGRFLAPDPQVADPGSTNGFNRYAYASNNPLMFVDLDGEQTVDGNSGYNGNTGNSAYWNQSMASMNYGISGSAYPRTGNPNNPNAGYGGGGANFGGGLNYGGGYSWESGAAGAIVSTLFYLFSSHKGSAQLEATNIVLDPRYSQYHAAKPKPLQKPVGTGAATVYAGGASNSRANHRILDGISTFSGYGSSVFSIIGEYAAFKRNIDYRSLANTMFEERIIKGKLGQIDEFGKIWRNANNSTLVKQALNTNLPLLSRYSNVFGRTGAVLTTIDVGTSLMKAGMSDDSGKQIYYTMEGFLKTPSYIPGIFGIAWGIGFDPVIRPIWEKGAETYRDAINRGADPSIVFIMPGLGYCPPIKHL